MVKREPFKKKDFIKIAAIAGVIIVPLLISQYVVNRELPENEVFWYGWTCQKIIDFQNSMGFDRLTDVTKNQFLKDYEECNESTP